MKGIKRKSIALKECRETLESISHPIDRRWSAILQDNLKDIEAPRDVTGFQEPEPLVGPALYQKFLLTVHRIEGSPGTDTSPSLHLDEDQSVTIPRHDIDLTTSRRAEVPVEDLASLRPNPLRAYPFSQLPDLLRGESLLPTTDRHGPPQQRAQTSNDGSERDHI